MFLLKQFLGKYLVDLTQCMIEACPGSDNLQQWHKEAVLWRDHPTEAKWEVVSKGTTDLVKSILADGYDKAMSSSDCYLLLKLERGRYYARFGVESKQAFWNTFLPVVRCAAALEVCGEHLACIEDVLREHLPSTTVNTTVLLLVVRQPAVLLSIFQKLPKGAEIRDLISQCLPIAYTFTLKEYQSFSPEILSKNSSKLEARKINLSERQAARNERQAARKEQQGLGFSQEIKDLLDQVQLDDMSLEDLHLKIESVETFLQQVVSENRLLEVSDALQFIGSFGEEEKQGLQEFLQMFSGLQPGDLLGILQSVPGGDKLQSLLGGSQGLESTLSSVLQKLQGSLSDLKPSAQRPASNSKTSLQNPKTSLQNPKTSRQNLKTSRQNPKTSLQTSVDLEALQDQLRSNIFPPVGLPGVDELLQLLQERMSLSNSVQQSELTPEGADSC